jgi:serine-type D-Ala-D-Ala carboxypeptidase/endopeptidase (penicillin-binding protein 4)
MADLGYNRCARIGVAMWSRLLSLAFLLLTSPALAGVKEKVAALAPSGVVLVMDATGNELVAQNADEPFVPASVAKIVTAWLTMEVLGGDYRFETRFYLDNKRVLYVRGGGDPFLTSEELAQLATKLVAAVGKEPITAIVLDASYYSSNLRIPGIEDTDEAYNALNSALAVNFNTVAAVRSGNKVRSAEKQTPITPLAVTQFMARGPNGGGRISLSQDPAVSLQYAGELIAAFIERAGGSVKGEISTGAVSNGLKPVYVHRRSRTLSEILVALFRASNNYIANQVFLEIGGRRLGGPVSLEKSLQVANEMLVAHGLAADIHLEEGSGISRNDRFTAGGLAKVLERIERRYGAPGPVLVAIWGLETDFGVALGKYPTFSAVATLAYDCRRADFYRAELIDALMIVQRGLLTPEEMRGAWAGELGQTQFMPSAYLKYGVSSNGGRGGNLIGNSGDALASTANFLQQHGWQREARWDPGNPNFAALLEWNNAEVYARTIAQFADRLAE